MYTCCDRGKNQPTDQLAAMSYTPLNKRSFFHSVDFDRKMNASKLSINTKETKRRKKNKNKHSNGKQGKEINYNEQVSTYMKCRKKCHNRINSYRNSHQQSKNTVVATIVVVVATFASFVNACI